MARTYEARLTKWNSRYLMSFRGIITRKEGREMLETAKLYKRVVPVKAIQITRRFSVESRSGVIETGNPGDYLLEDTLVPDDLWIVRRSVFEAEFELASGKATSRTEPKSSDKRQTRPNIMSSESV